MDTIFHSILETLESVGTGSFLQNWQNNAPFVDQKKNKKNYPRLTCIHWNMRSCWVTIQGLFAHTKNSNNRILWYISSVSFRVGLLKFIHMKIAVEPIRIHTLCITILKSNANRLRTWFWYLISRNPVLSHFALPKDNVQCCVETDKLCTICTQCEPDEKTDDIRIWFIVIRHVDTEHLLWWRKWSWEIVHSRKLL